MATRPGNIDLLNRPSVPNPDGGESSVYSMSVNIDNEEVLIPRVSDDGRMLTEDEAVSQYAATGKHLGKFSSPEEATKFAGALHNQQAALESMGTGIKAPPPAGPGRMSTQDPISAPSSEVPYEPPVERPPDTFQSDLKEAFQDQEFAAAPPEQQQEYIGLLMQKDENLRGLNNDERREYLSYAVKGLEEDDRYSRSLAGQYEAHQNETLGDWRGTFKEKALNLMEKVPGSGIFLSAETMFWRGLGAVVQDSGSKAEWMLEKMDEGWTPPEPTGNEATDAKRLRAYEILSGRETGPETQDFLDGIESMIASVAGNKELGQRMMDQADKVPQKINPPTLEKLLGSKGFISGAANLTGLTVKTVADSFGVMLPAIMMGDGKTAFMIGMQSVHSGLQADAANELGLKIDNADQQLSGAVQAGLTMAAGPQAAMKGKLGVELIESLKKSGFKRLGTRVLAEMGLEGVTEFAQEYVNQQVPLWTNEQKGYWANLNDQQKSEIIQGALVAPLGAGPFAAIKGREKGRSERKIGEALGKLSDLREDSELTPEERVERGRPDLLVDKPAPTMDDLSQARLEAVPDFVANEDLTAWADGSLDVSKYDQGQQDQLYEATTRVEKEIFGVRPEAIELKDKNQRRMIEVMAEHAENRADVELEAGNIELSEQYRKGAKGVTFVAVPEGAKYDWMREAQILGNKLGVNMEFFDTPEGVLSNAGMIVGKGTVGLRFRPDSQKTAVGAFLLHEVTHNVEFNDPVIAKALAGTMADLMPKQWAEAEAKTKVIEKANATPFSRADFDSEQLAYFMENNAKDFFLTMGKYSDREAYDNAPRGIRRLLDKIQKWLQKILKESPALARGLGINVDAMTAGEKFNVGEVMRAMGEAIESTSMGYRPESVRVEKVRERSFPVENVKVGDNVTIATGIGGEVTAISQDKDANYRVEIGDDTHIIPPKTRLKERLEAPVKPPKAEPAPAPKKKPKPEPAPKAQAPADDGAQRRLFAEEILAKEPRAEVARIDGDDAEGTQLLLHKNTRPGEGPWRITTLSIDGDPAFHTDYPSYTKAKEIFGIMVENAAGRGQQIELSERDLRTPARTMSAAEKQVEETERATKGKVKVNVEPGGGDEGGQYTIKIVDSETGKEIGHGEITLRMKGTADETVWFEWIDADKSVTQKSRPESVHGEAYGGLGTRGVLALRDQLQEFFPDSRWVGGMRVSGTHNKAVPTEIGGPEHNVMIRIPIHTKSQRTKRGIPLVPRTESELILIHGLDTYYGHPDRIYDDVDLETDMVDSELGLALNEADHDPDKLQLELEDDPGLQEYLIQQMRHEDERSAVELLPEAMKNWTSEDWNKYGDKYGVPNMGGLSPLEKHGKAELPGGVEGTFTYEELLWIKAANINPEESWTEEEHAEFQRKLSRTLTPSEGDTLSALSAMTFSILSPNLNLSLNEALHSMIRMRNNEEVAEWAARVPWDVTEGEVPSREVYDRMSDQDKDDMALWYAEVVKKRRLKGDQVKVAEWRGKVEKLSDALIAKNLRDYHDDKIKHSYQMQQGALGVGFTSPLSNIAELAQFYQKDPDWFMIGEGESWYAFTNRLSSQLNGVGTKVAAFGAVWQDPMHAAISAIDRHMARIFRDEIFDQPHKRKEFEQKVFDQWNARHKSAQIEMFPPQSIDEIMQLPGGTGLVTRILMEYVSRDVRKRTDVSKDDFKFLSDPKKLQLMSREYENALKYNVREAKRLNLGVFAAQHLLWDRHRRKVEPHHTNFPGLYKLPHRSWPEVKRYVDKLKELGHTGTAKEFVMIDGEREFRLKRARSAPPGELAHATAEAPSAFERGSSRSLVAPYSSVQPLSSLDPTTGPMWTIPDESWLGWLRNRYQDAFVRVAELQRGITEFTGVTIRDDIDPYLAEMLYHNKAAGQVETFERDFVKPLMDELRKAGADIPAFEEWLWARHTKERNDHYKDVWYDRPKKRLTEEIEAFESDMEYLVDQGGDPTTLRRRIAARKRQLAKLDDKATPTSGMSTEDAKVILDKAGDKYKAQAKLFDKMMNRKLTVLLEGGLITEQQYDTLKNAYEFYVPLKGKNYEGDLESILDDIGAGTGRGFDIRGDELGFSFGRMEGDAHTHPIISQAVVDIEEALIRVEKNEVGKAFLGLAEEFANKDVWEVNKRVRRRVWDKDTGEVKLVEDALAKKADNVLAVKVDGETFYVTIIDARLASAVKNLGRGQNNWVVNTLGAASRFMAKINTSLNPEFMVANFSKDLQTAFAHLNEEQANGIAAETMKNLPAAMRGIAGAEFEPAGETKWSDSYQNFIDNGGKMGFFGYNDVLSKARSLQRMIHRQGPGAKNMTFRGIAKLGSIIEAGNTVVENGVRLAAFQTAVDNGMTEKRAAALALNLTVNFSKKGVDGSVMNAVWLFSNASIQGTTRMFTALKRSRRVRRIASTMFMSSFALASLNRAFGGDDEEDEHSYWEKLPDWQKETNLVFMIPGSKGDHIKIPLPYGYNVFNVLGIEAERIAHSIYSGTFKPVDTIKAAVNVTDAMLGAFNPLGSTRLDSSWGLTRFAVPSVFAPIADSLVNETYYGAPIQPTRSSWDKSPNSARYFNGVSKLSKTLAEWANEQTGGNAYQPGAIDASPEILDYLVGSYAGAGPKTGKRLLFDNLGWLLTAQGDLTKIEANDVAFLRRVYGEQNDHTVASMYYENVEEIDQAQKAWENLSTQKEFDRPAWRKRHGWKRRLFEDMRKAQNLIRKESDPDKKNKIRKRFNRQYRRAWLGQF